MGGLLAWAGSAIRGARRLATRIWDDHQNLLRSNATYRRQLNIAATAILAACAVHPTAATIASAVLAVWVAAYDDGNGGWDQGGLGYRSSRWD